MLRNSLVLRERQQELDRQKARETVNRQNTIASLYRRTVQNEYEQVRMQLAFRDSTTGSEYEAASASASASAATARRGVRSDWDSETQKQMLAEGGGDQEKLQTIEEIEAETEAFKKEKQCAYESCTNDYSVLYLHGSDAIAHIIHCQEHALSIDDRCPRCDQAIKGVVPIYLT
ncbi:MAG: hypothetical protein KAG53_02045 [Endozoicomonadaceae bacterium]|nr:hypothetical protein [Endozoicomonadaceae bacterium]